MPRPGSARLIRLCVNFFLARFSPSDIDRAARAPLRIGVAGDPELVRGFRHLIAGDRVSAEAPFPSLSLHPLPVDDPAHHWPILDDCQLIVVLLSREDLLGDTIYRIRGALPEKVSAVWAAVGQIEPWLRYEIDEIERELKLHTFVWLEELTDDGARPLLRVILGGLGGYELSAARKMPLLRDPAASRIITRTARQNLVIAMASAVPASLPWLGPIVGILGVTGEIIFLTSNQLRMVLQIASIYERDMNVGERVKEVLPVIGGAFGWRALSRQLVGFIPTVGPGIKGSVAFAATIVTGEAARWFYKTGTHMDDEQKHYLYKQAIEKASAVTATIGARVASIGRARLRETGASPADKCETDDLSAWSERVFEVAASAGTTDVPAQAEVSTEEAPVLPEEKPPEEKSPEEKPIVNGRDPSPGTHEPAASTDEAAPDPPEIPRGVSHASTKDETCPATGVSGHEEARGNASFREKPRARRRPRIDVEKNARRRKQEITPSSGETPPTSEGAAGTGFRDGAPREEKKEK